MSPVVSLDVLPADVPAEYAPAMVTACSDALAEGRCALASTLPESTQPEAVALVLWQGDGFLQVTVRVGRGGGQWVARALTFSERDSISERWTTVGLTVATLVGETRALDAKPPGGGAHETPVQSGGSSVELAGQHARAAASTSHVTKPAVASPRAGPRHSWLGSLGALAGPGWAGGEWQYGGWVSVGFCVPGWPVVVHALGSYALSAGPSVQSAEPSTRWATVGLGAGLFGTIRALDLTGSAALELAYRRVDVDLRGASAADQEVPIRLRAFASFPAGGPLAATAGVVVRLPPGNPSDSHGLSLREAAFPAEVVAGLEVRL